jgi:hypothetical protein
MNWTKRSAARAIAVVLGISFVMSMMTEPASAWWRRGCWGCGAFAAGAIAGAALARPAYVAPYYYGAPRPVVYPPYPAYPAYPVCPIRVNPWYCR